LDNIAWDVRCVSFRRDRAGGGIAAAGGRVCVRRGGTPPSFDGHRETTFAMLHPIAPHMLRRNTTVRIRQGNFDAGIDFTCEFMDEPDL